MLFMSQTERAYSL